MNENPEGTPNPLNPNPGVAPVQPTPAAPDPQPMPAEQPVVSEPVIAPAQPVAPEPTQMKQPVATEPAAPAPVSTRPKKTGLIVATVLFFVAIIAGITAAIVILNPFGNKVDAVPAAIAKLFSNEAPSNVSLSGKISLVSNDEDSPISMLAIDFKAGVKSATLENYTNATVMATFNDDSEFTFNADEIMTSDGDLYLRLSNIAEALGDYQATTRQAEVIMPQPGETVLDFIGVFEVIDDEWIRIPGSQFSSLTDVADVEGPTQCLIDAAGKLGEYGSDFVTLYKNNPFITYSTDNLKITQKTNQLYLLGFDAEKLTGFINGMSNLGFMNELLACMDETAVNQHVTVSQVQSIIDLLPTIYTEIDDDNNFTRVYLKVAAPEGESEATADISLSYPSNISIEEPEVYIDINDVLSQLLTMFYNQDDIDFVTE